MNDEPKPRLKVSLSVPAHHLSEADQAWGLSHPAEVNAALSRWYRHGRKCRRLNQRRGATLEGGPGGCICG